MIYGSLRDSAVSSRSFVNEQQSMEVIIRRCNNVQYKVMSCILPLWLRGHQAADYSRTPVTIVWCTSASWHSPGLHHLLDYLPISVTPLGPFLRCYWLYFMSVRCLCFVFIVLYYLLKHSLPVPASRLPAHSLHVDDIDLEAWIQSKPKC